MKNILFKTNVVFVAVASIVAALAAYVALNVRAFTEKGLSDSRKIRVMGEASVCTLADKDEPRFNGCNTIL